MTHAGKRHLLQERRDWLVLRLPGVCWGGDPESDAVEVVDGAPVVLLLLPPLLLQALLLQAVVMVQPMMALVVSVVVVVLQQWWVRQWRRQR